MLTAEHRGCVVRRGDGVPGACQALWVGGWVGMVPSQRPKGHISAQQGQEKIQEP